MNKIVQRIVTLLLVFLLTCGMFPAALATDAAPEDTTADETLSVESDAVLLESYNEPGEPTEPVEPLSPTEPSEPAPPVTEDVALDATFTEETVTASPIFFDTGSIEEAPMLMAIDDGIMLAADNSVTGTHYQRAIVWLTGGEKINFAYKGKNYSLTRLYTHGVIVGGKRYIAYCIDPGIDTSQVTGAYTGSEAAWSNLDINTQSAVGLAILYGAPNKLSSTDKRTMLTYELATQIIIHEIILGFRRNVPPYDCTDSRIISRMTYGNSNYFREISSQSKEYSSISGKYMDKAVLKKAYDTISASLASHYVLPSFASRYNAAAKTYEMTKKSDGSYAVTLTDTNGVLANCSFKSGNGLSYSVSGNKLTIKASTAFEGTKSCALSSGVGVSKQVPNLESETFMLWEAGSYQRIVSLQEPLNDPLPLYFNVETPIQNGTAKIIKLCANPEAYSVEGWNFTITDSAGKKVGTYKTDSAGVFTTDLVPGTYIVTEVLEEGSLWQCTTANPQTITVKAGSTAEVTFTNALRPGKLQVQKVNERGEPLAGAEFLLEWSSDGKTWIPITYTDSAVPQIGASTTAGIKNGKLITGNTGLIEFTGLYPTLSYRLTETNAPDGYQLLSKPVFVGTLPADQDLSLGFTVTNIPVFKLPETGSRSMVMTISGLVLCCIACVGVIYFLRRKEQ